jgi:pimeloyl-ACP methyl ester carboxylesterase
MLIHGMANDAELCYGKIVPYLLNYYVILCELDGHTDKESGLFVSIEDSCGKIENYVKENLDGKLYGLTGFSMGATICVELMSRANIQIDNVVLDAAWCVKLSKFKQHVFTSIFCHALKKIKAGKRIPKFLIERSMGKGNAGIVNTFYKGVDLQSIRNACRDVYDYEIPDNIIYFDGQVAFWHGSREPYPKESARLLKDCLPQMQVEVFRKSGHGQFLNEHPYEYAEKLKEFFK